MTAIIDLMTDHCIEIVADGGRGAMQLLLAILNIEVT